MADFKEWEGFEGRLWKEGIDVRDFIQNNYKPYDGDESFLEGPTDATDKLWGELQKLQKEERAKGGVLDMETEVVTGITAYGPGYIDEELKDLEQVVGLQTDVRSCLMVVFVWQSSPVRCMVMSQARNCMRSLQNIIKRTVTLSLRYIHRR